jgi:hypothetical protein
MPYFLQTERRKHRPCRQLFALSSAIEKNDYLSRMKTRLILPLCLSLLAAIHSNAQCTISCPQNIVVKADSGKVGTNVQFGTASTTGDCGPVTYTPASGSFFKIGSSSVIATTASGARCSFTVTVTDNESPLISPLTLSYQRLWPANGKTRDVALWYKTYDNVDSSSCTVTVTSNEPGGGTGGAEVVNNHLVRLKASRLPDGSPRVYTITVRCMDASGNTARRSKTISVAKNTGKN